MEKLGLAYLNGQSRFSKLALLVSRSKHHGVTRLGIRRGVRMELTPICHNSYPIALLGGW